MNWAGSGWAIVEGDDFERGAMQCGGLQAIEEIIAPIKLGLSRNPFGFHETEVPGIRIARTKLRVSGFDVVLSHSIWFRIDEEQRQVVLLWVEITKPDDVDWDDNDIPF